MDRLPPEIHLEILAQGFTIPPARLGDNVGSVSKEEREKRQALIAYGSASNAFRDRSHPFLFDSVVLQLNLGQRRPERLEALEGLKRIGDLLSESSRLGGMVHYITSFNLHINAPSKMTNLNDPSLRSALVPILDALHGPHHGIMSFNFILHCHTPWDFSSVDDGFGPSFQRLLQSPKLEHALIEKVSRVPRNIMEVTKIQRIELYNVHFDHNSTPKPARVVNAIGIDETVALYHTINAVDGSEGHLIAKASKHIYSDITTVTSLVNMVAYATPATLLSFHVRISGPTFLPENGKPSLDLSAFIELSTLRISEFVGSNPIEPLKHVLDDSVLPPKLEELYLHALVRVDWGEGGASEQLQAHRDKFHDLDKILASKFAAISKIHLSVHFHVVNESQGAPFDKAAFQQTAERLLDEAFSGMLSQKNSRVVEARTVVQDISIAAESERGDRRVVVRCGGRRPINVPFYGFA